MPSNVNGLGLAMLGPFEDNSTYVCLRGPGDASLFRNGRYYQATHHVHRWLVTQGLDWIRRAVLGRLESPVDWNLAADVVERVVESEVAPTTVGIGRSLLRRQNTAELTHFNL